MNDPNLVLDPASWEQNAKEELTDLEQAIVAEAEKVRAAARAEILKARKSELVKELEQVEKDISAFISPEPAPAKEEPKVEAPKSKPRAAKPAGKDSDANKDSGASSKS